MFKAACKKAPLCKTSIFADINIIGKNHSISLIDKRKLIIDIQSIGVQLMDGNKLMADVNRRESQTCDGEYRLNADGISATSMHTCGGTDMMLPWRGMIMNLINNGPLQFVKDDIVLLKKNIFDAEGQPVDRLLMDERVSLCLFGKAGSIWKDTLFFVSDITYKLFSVDLAKTLQSREVVSTEHAVNCNAFDFNKRGDLVCVTDNGHATLLNHKILNTDNFDKNSTTAQIVMNDDEMFEAVGVSDRTILLGSRILNPHNNSKYRLTTMSKVTVTLKPVGHIDIPAEHYQYAFIHSIIFITKHKVEFAVVCTYYALCHLSAIRYHRLELVQSNYILDHAFMRSFCQYDDSIMVTIRNAK